MAATLKMMIVYLNAHGTPKLEGIRNLSGSRDRYTAKRAVRSILGSFPGFVRFNALRKKYGHGTTRPGNYHLFCVMKNEAGAATTH